MPTATLPYEDVIQVLGDHLFYKMCEDRNELERMLSSEMGVEIIAEGEDFVTVKGEDVLSFSNK